MDTRKVKLISSQGLMSYTPPSSVVCICSPFPAFSASVLAELRRASPRLLKRVLNQPLGFGFISTANVTQFHGHRLYKGLYANTVPHPWTRLPSHLHSLPCETPRGIFQSVILNVSESSKDHQPRKSQKSHYVDVVRDTIFKRWRLKWIEQ